jgi:hypothetical protein
MSTPVRRALYGKLSGDTTLTNLLGTPATGFSKSIYHAQAPAGAGFPFVILNKQSGVPTETFTDPSGFEDDIWLVKGIDRGTTADTAEAIAARVKTLLNDATLTISGATHLATREGARIPATSSVSIDVEYLETVAGDGVRLRRTRGASTSRSCSSEMGVCALQARLHWADTTSTRMSK